jgi:hypothetical protein
MRRLGLLLSLALAAASHAGCGKDEEKTGAPPASAGATLEGAAGARAVVEAYFAAAKVPDRDAMLALGTPEWQEKEKTGDRRFTPMIANGTFRLKSFEIREPSVAGDKATVSTRAVFVDKDGKEDPEGMRFGLVRKDGRWWISDLG